MTSPPWTVLCAHLCTLWTEHNCKTPLDLAPRTSTRGLWTEHVTRLLTPTDWAWRTPPQIKWTEHDYKAPLDSALRTSAHIIWTVHNCRKGAFEAAHRSQ